MELEGEFLLQDPTNLTITPMNLALPVARLNSRIRCTGISACELHVQCMYTTGPIDPDTDTDNSLF